jgi:hypothetical protein
MPKEFIKESVMGEVWRTLYFPQYSYFLDGHTHRVHIFLEMKQG